MKINNDAEQICAMIKGNINGNKLNGKGNVQVLNVPC